MGKDYREMRLIGPKRAEYTENPIGKPMGLFFIAQ